MPGHKKVWEVDRVLESPGRKILSAAAAESDAVILQAHALNQVVATRDALGGPPPYPNVRPSVSFGLAGPAIAWITTTGMGISRHSSQSGRTAQKVDDP